MIFRHIAPGLLRSPHPVIDMGNTERSPKQLPNKERLLVGQPCRCDHANGSRSPLPDDPSEVVSNTADRVVPVCRQQLAISPYAWRTDPSRVLSEMKLEAAFVTHPVAVDLIIHSGADSEDLSARLLMPDIHGDVAPGAAEPAYRRNLFDQIPRPRGKAIIPACQR